VKIRSRLSTSADGCHHAGRLGPC